MPTKNSRFENKNEKSNLFPVLQKTKSGKSERNFEFPHKLYGISRITSEPLYITILPG